jgi:hypothetical protein
VTVGVENAGMSEDEMLARELSARGDALLEYAGKILDGASVINSFADHGSVAGLIAYMLRSAGRAELARAAEMRTS